MTDWNTKIIEEFRANGGKVGGPFEGATLVLLHTTGARSGADRVNPLACQPVGDDLAVFGSAAGSDKTPDWVHNLRANPNVTFEIGTETRTAVAREATGDERDRIWARQKELMPGFADYEAKTARVIPVILLERAGG